MQGKTLNRLVPVLCMGLSTLATQSVQAFELLAEHIEDYSASTSADLPGCTNTTTGLVGEFDNASWSRTWWSDNGAWEQDYLRESLPGGDDNNWSDDADFSYFCGHGNVGFVEFTTNNPGRFLNNIGVRWGDVDVEWVTFDTSFTFRFTGTNLNAWYSNGFDGLHLLVGWHDSPLDGDTGGQYADELIDTGAFDGGGNTVTQAWFSSSGGCTDQTSGTMQSILAEIQAHFDDRIHGEGSNAGDQPNNGLGWLRQNSC